MKIILVFMLMFCVYMFFKNENTYRQHKNLADAIFAYGVDCIRNDREWDHMLYESMEPYEATLFRLWDWGYTRILPPEKFELIKDYIKEK